MLKISSPHIKIVLSLETHTHACCRRFWFRELGVPLAFGTLALPVSAFLSLLFYCNKESYLWIFNIHVFLFCYWAPSLRITGFVQQKDCYSFDIHMQVRHILNDRKKLRKVIDPEMARNSYTIQSIVMFANLASRCVRTESNERPSIVECIKELLMIIYTNSKGLGMVMHSLRMI